MCYTAYDVYFYEMYNLEYSLFWKLGKVVFDNVKYTILWECLQWDDFTLLCGAVTIMLLWRAWSWGRLLLLLLLLLVRGRVDDSIGHHHSDGQVISGTSSSPTWMQVFSAVQGHCPAAFYDVITGQTEFISIVNSVKMVLVYTSRRT